MTALRELQLVELYRAKGPEAQAALNELLEGYQRRVYSICARMLRKEEDARDVTQDALIRVIEGLDSYDGRAKLSTWIIRVTMNCCLSHLRRERVRKHETLPADSQEHATSRTPDRGGARVHSIGPDAVGREQSPVGSVEQTEVRKVLLEALDRLDPDMRAVLVLRDMQDLEYDQIALVMNIPSGTVKSRLFRARTALKEMVMQMVSTDGREMVDA